MLLPCRVSKLSRGNCTGQFLIPDLYAAGYPVGSKLEIIINYIWFLWGSNIQQYFALDIFSSNLIIYGFKIALNQTAFPEPNSL